MSRSWELFLRDMLESAPKIVRFTAGCTSRYGTAPYEDLKLKPSR